MLLHMSVIHVAGYCLLKRQVLRRFMWHIVGWSSITAVSGAARHRSGTGSCIYLYTATAHVTAGASTSGRKALLVLDGFRRDGVSKFDWDELWQQQRACCWVLCARLLLLLFRWRRRLIFVERGHRWAHSPSPSRAPGISYQGTMKTSARMLKTSGGF